MDSDHARDKVSFRSRSGFLIYVNTTLMQLFPKNQSTLEKSVFDAEFFAMKWGVDFLRGLRYKLRMMGITLSSLGIICQLYITHPDQLILLSCSL